MKTLKIITGLFLVFVMVSTLFIYFNPKALRKWSQSFYEKCYCNELQFQKEIKELEWRIALEKHNR